MLVAGIGGQVGAGPDLIPIGIVTDAMETHKAVILRSIAQKVYSEYGRLPIGVAMVAEAWMGTDVPPSTDPHRQEVAMVSTLTLGGDAFLATSPIQRDEQGRITLGEWKEQEVVASNLLREFFAGLANENKDGSA